MEELKKRSEELREKYRSLQYAEGEYIAPIEELCDVLQCNTLIKYCALSAVVYKYGKFENRKKTYISYEINYDKKNDQYTLLCSNKQHPPLIGDYGGCCETILDAEHCTYNEKNGTITMKNIYKTFLGTDEPFFSMGPNREATYFPAYQFIMENFVQTNWKYYPIEIAVGRQDEIILK